MNIVKRYRQSFLLFILFALFGTGYAATCGTSSMTGTAYEIEEAAMSLNNYRVPFWRNFPLGTYNSSITHAVIIVHGNRQSARVAGQHACRAAYGEGLLDTTIVLAPKFLISDESPASNEFYWRNEDWKQGKNSLRDGTTSSFAVVDKILDHLFNNFPNLKKITVAGHSAGGQYVQRYAAINHKDTSTNRPSGVTIRYVAANPSSYMFTSPYNRTSERYNCFSTYNNYRYGLGGLPSALSYTNSSQTTIKSQFAARDVYIMIGENDTGSASLDTACGAEAQGQHRYERAYNYITDVRQHLTNHHNRFFEIPDADHSSSHMFGSSKSKRGPNIIMHVPFVDGDYNGDGRADYATWNPTTAEWKIRYSDGSGTRSLVFNTAGDKPIPQNYTADGYTQVSIWSPSDSYWRFISSQTGTVADGNIPLVAGSNDKPIPGDFDGDGQADFTFISSGVWRIRYYSTGSNTTYFWGTNAKAVPGDYDGDGTTDIAYWVPSTRTWHYRSSINQQSKSYTWGSSSSNIPVPGDYDGDGVTDFAVWKPGSYSGTWSIKKSSGGGTITRTWGLATDLPVPGDYDGDGKTDIAVWRPSTRQWFQIRSSNGSTTGPTWGSSGDIPLSPHYIHR